MKKFATILALAATLVSNGAFAQNTNKTNGNMNRPAQTTGAAAQQGTYSTYDNFAWGLGLAGLAVVGIVVGVTVGAAVKDGPTFSH